MSITNKSSLEQELPDSESRCLPILKVAPPLHGELPRTLTSDGTAIVWNSWPREHRVHQSRGLPQETD